MPQPLPPRAELSESTALALSIGGTAASWAMVVIGTKMDEDGDEDGEAIATAGAFGTFLLPSLGHWYAREYWSRGMGVRLLGAGTALTGAVIAFSECPLFSGDDCDSTSGSAVILLGALLYIGGTIDDIISAPSAARAYNNRGNDLRLVPLAQPRGGGMALLGTF